MNPATMPQSTILELLPAFASELADLASRVGRSDLAGQIPALPVVARCTCGQDDCAHFYTAPRPDGAYGDGHVNVELPAASGLVVLDVVDDRVVAVEVLDRPDVKSALDLYWPDADHG